MSHESAADAPYDLARNTIAFPVFGMTCAACVRRVDKALRGLPGVAEVDVNLATERASIVVGAGVDPGELRERAAAAVRARGYEVPADAAPPAPPTVTPPTGAEHATSAEDAPPTPDEAERSTTGEGGPRMGGGDVREAPVGPAPPPAPDASPRHADAFLARQRRELIHAWVFAFPLLLIGMIPMMIPALHHAVAARVGEWNWHFVLFLLATPIQFGPGRRFFRLGWAALRHGEPDMNTLVAVGTGVAWSWSTLVLFAPQWLPAGDHPVWFEASGLVVAILLLGKYLETLARGAAGRAIGALLDLRPDEATVEDADGSTRRVAATSLRPGDRLVVRPGERVAADARVETGRGWADESMLTGESREVEKADGAELVCGTVLVAGSVRARVLATGPDTRLAGIVRLVEDAQGRRPRLQRVADRVVGVFVPVVFAIAALTFGLWYASGSLDDAVLRSVAVLVIACPCAMGLAVPVSVLVGTGRGARLGVLYRRGDVIESFAEVGHVAFDKTGTLTVGRPRVVDVSPVEVAQDAAATHDRAADPSLDLLALAARVEADAEHPTGRAIVAAAMEAGADVRGAEGFASVAGHGVSARVDGVPVRVGSARWIGVAPEVQQAAEARAEGASRVWIEVDGVVRGSIAVADELREGAIEAVQALRAQGVGVSIITGDGRATALRVAHALGIDGDAVHAEVLPGDKAGVVEAIRARSGRPVAFVGDGVNDAPALATADVGIAMGTGTDVALETGDVVLMTGDPRGMVRALGLSRAVMRNLRWNLVWAFGYNVLLIPVAAGALVGVHPDLALSPVLAGAAMALSSLFVVGNALRLRTWEG